MNIEDAIALVGERMEVQGWLIEEISGDLVRASREARRIRAGW